MKLYRQAHVVYKAQYHIVWVTRFRRKILNKGISSYFKIKVEEVRKYYPDWYFLAISTDIDHVHIHMIFPPKYSGSTVVETLKKNTSRSIRNKFAHFLDNIYWDGGGIWAKGYFLSTVGINEQTIRNYVRKQGEEDTGQAQLEL